MNAIAPRRQLALNLLANYGQLLLMAAVTVFLLPLYLRLLGPAQWGLVAQCLALQGLLFALELALGPPLLRDLAAAPERAPAVFGAYLRSYLRLALPLFVAGQALLALYPPDAALAWPLRLALVQWLFQFCNGAALGYWNGLQRHGEANRRLALALLCKHALALLLITQWQASAVAWLLPFVLIGLVELVLNLRAVRAQAPAAPAATAYAAGRAVAAYAPAAALGLLTGQVDRLVLAVLLPAADYGRYFLAATVVLSLLQLQMPIQRAFLPRLAAAAAPRRELRAMLRASLLLVVVPSLLLASLAPPLLRLWLHDAATAAVLAAPLRLMLLGVAALAIYAPFGAWLLAQRRHRRLALINGLTLALQLAVLLRLTPSLGFTAGALAWLVCGLVQLAFVPWTGLPRVEPAHD
ncbi:hypothetical protein [Tahibacter harae]|uniref:O-antigen/teichoic acid export membrane protein n=1 Tax=Tahibacter harae TaxID=2963937 RepID=A0ABT1QP16_9GAMM|nr:hypothetical protein [Tahibacter harae]MCQ4163637.1 hypothetical protein [Tahibacter harae]